MSWGFKKKVQQDFDEQKYFDEQKPVQPQPQKAAQDSEEDQLDAFMKSLSVPSKPIAVKEKQDQQLVQVDPVDDYFQSVKKKIRKQNKAAMKERGQLEGEKEDSEDLECEFIDSDGDIDLEAVRNSKKKKIEILEPLDFTNILLEHFERNFYVEHPQITAMTEDKVKQYRKSENMKVRGRNVPKPIISFGYLGFSEQLIDLISRNKFEKPTPIQSQALPAALSGRDVVGIAKTGSGKTLAYVWPMLIHILDQRQLQKHEGPIGLVLAPTRQLCQQIYIQTKKYCKKFNLTIGCLLGGENKHEQWKTLKAGVDILIASPGRLIEMIKKKATNLLRVTYLVIDEADKMFSLGFEQQLRSIIGQTRDDRQTMLFTATLRRTVQSLVADFLVSPVTINIGQENQANEDIRQQIMVFPQEQGKLQWLQKHLRQCLQRGKVLIFVNHINQCQSLIKHFKDKMGISALSLHGDKTQFQRTSIINSFKLKQTLLIATDVASRGLDVRQIKTVINYDPPKDSDTYIHRIGRTGRAGDKDGQAYTLLLEKDWKFAIMLIRILEATECPVPPHLEEVAMKDDKFRLRRLSNKMGVSFAKGKDATKLLNQALKRQRNSNIKAGIGYVEPDLLKKSQRELELKDIIEQNRSAMRVDSLEKPLQLGQLNVLLKFQNERRFEKPQLKPGAKTKFGGTFVAAQVIQSNPDNQRITITYAKNTKPPQPTPEDAEKQPKHSGWDKSAK